MAKHFLSQSFPVTDVFDNLLINHIAPQVRRQRHLQMWAFNQSLFAQVGKVTPSRILPSALLSYERVVGRKAPNPDQKVEWAGSRLRRNRKRPMVNVYQPARPLGR